MPPAPQSRVSSNLPHVRTDVICGVGIATAPLANEVLLPVLMHGEPHALSFTRELARTAIKELSRFVGAAEGSDAASEARPEPHAASLQTAGLHEAVARAPASAPSSAASLPSAASAPTQPNREQAQRVESAPSARVQIRTRYIAAFIEWKNSGVSQRQIAIRRQLTLGAWVAWMSLNRAACDAAFAAHRTPIAKPSGVLL